MTVASVPLVVDTTNCSIIHAHDLIEVGISKHLPRGSNEICKATSSSGDSSVVVVEAEAVAATALDLRFGALEGSHHSGYPIRS